MKQNNPLEPKKELKDDLKEEVEKSKPTDNSSVESIIDSFNEDDVQNTKANNIDDDENEGDDFDEFKNESVDVDDISQDNNSKSIIKQIEKSENEKSLNSDVKNSLRNKKYSEKAMKLDELQEDAKKLKISIITGNKKKTKAQLINDIVLELK